VSAKSAFHEGVGWGVPRLELSRALLQQALTFDCLEICTNVQATPIQIAGKEEDQYPLVKIGNDYIRARLLIGADGLNSVVRRWAGLDRPNGDHARWGIRRHFQIAPWSRHVEVHWANGIEAYVTPCGENLVGVAFLWDRKRHPHLPGGRQLFPALLQSFPVIQERLRSGAVSDSTLAIGPMQRKAIQPVADGVLLIGDAAGYLDALTGEGISLALAQALSLEETVVPLLLASGQRRMLSAADLSCYHQAYQTITRPYYQMTHFAIWLSHHPLLVEYAIRILRLNPVLFQSLLSANMGVIPLWQVPYFAIANAIAPRRAVS